MKKDRRNKQQIDTSEIQTHHFLFNPTADGLPSEFPFRIVCSLLPLIEDLRRRAKENPDRYRKFAEDMEVQLGNDPALMEPITDFSLLRNHQETTELLLKPLISDQDWTMGLRAVVDPLGMYMLYGTPLMEEMLHYGKDENFMRFAGSSTLYVRILYAYKAILHKYYDYEMQVDQPVILVMPDKSKQMDRYLKLNASSEYISINNLKPVPKLSPAEIDKPFSADNYDLLKNFFNITS